MFVGSTGGEKKLKEHLFSLSCSVLGMTVNNVLVGWLQDSQSAWSEAGSSVLPHPMPPARWAALCWPFHSFGKGVSQDLW